ncbi:unnamed protein product [Cylicostephanus goldi]|uniref:Neurotransmitter-gated ion-channel ligand-binding domain-containing protein n=1 Tax=Cylicostephanus goldi TaxID=71465 RepID=A0A3P6QZL0_CYLGO|nr:unnamed protein product [Cylicostephanus goldi]
MSIVPNTNTMNVDVIITRTWNDPSLYFAHLQPCHPYLNLISQRNNLWIPELSFPLSNGAYEHDTTIQLNRDGTIVHSTRLVPKDACYSNGFCSHISIDFADTLKMMSGEAV